MVERDNIQCTVNQFDFTVFNRYTLIFTIRDSLIKHNIISTWLIIFAMEEDVYILGCKSINCESEIAEFLSIAPDYLRQRKNGFLIAPIKISLFVVDPSDLNDDCLSLTVRF